LGLGSLFALGKGAWQAMMTSKLKLPLSLVVLLGLVTAGALCLGGPEPADRDRPAAAAKAAPPAAGKKAAQRHCIILWMNGGPSQLDTFDPKPGQKNGGPFRAIHTGAEGVRVSEHLPRMAKLGRDLVIVRTVTHGEGDHQRATYLMRTGHSIGDQRPYPSLGSLLAKELGGPADLPPYVAIGAEPRFTPGAYGPGFLGAKFAPLTVTAPGAGEVPDLDAFRKIDKDKAAQMREAVTAAFDLTQERAIVRDAYGRNAFGEGCLLARRLVERGVPVVEVTLGGWDTHQNNFGLVEKLSGQLDPAWAALLSDLRHAKLLENTVVVWMGEFGRTPRINANDGRDHWPHAFCAVLAGGHLKGGQAIGRTSADGTKIEERPVTPPELLATVFAGLGVHPASTNRDDRGEAVPLVEKGTRPVREALR
jgi:hypothetical protein